MKKALTRKLTLQKETLRSLEEPSLREANGGTDSEYRTCETCGISCDPVTVRGCTTTNLGC